MSDFAFFFFNLTLQTSWKGSQADIKRKLHIPSRRSSSTQTSCPSTRISRASVSPRACTSSNFLSVKDIGFHLALTRNLITNRLLGRGCERRNAARQYESRRGGGFTSGSRLLLLRRRFLFKLPVCVAACAVQRTLCLTSAGHKLSNGAT